MAESTAFLPAVRSMVMVMVPPGATLTGNVIHAPSRNDVVNADCDEVEPSDTVTT